MNDIIYFPEGFTLENCETLRDFKIAYHSFGTLNAARDNVVWVCHALTANSDIADWWPHTVETGKFLDPGKWFVVCANIIGSPYGSTSPMSVNPATGKPYYTSFPRYTIRDIARAHALLAEKLGIGRIHALVGSSVGGFQAVEWAVMEPERFSRLILIATDAKASPWSIALDETQRMAIRADKSYEECRPGGGAAGLAAARAIGLLSYRGPYCYNLTQQDPAPDNADCSYDPYALHRAQTYQHHQGKKLVDRFDAYCYMAILDAFDTHDAGRDRGGLDKALARISCPTAVIAISSDIIFTPPEMKALAALIPGASYFEIDSPFGHDGFLVEPDLLNSILYPFINDDCH